ncbi:hypothetical protein [Notoacmeibacter sp. MSK16QG-6]|uniref:hypothetical protein n=1 Tax=Notoacmeibacter sp. MSK16QG-6 TaxID=2957982 RepID=UPI00209CA00C|nr:hypothetical protein [Notoacmeibacter sp. MSK16QG-6]MCP1199282.1 hypothetical protein [Notoacmeibacter sp. MSK16QG-6]
MITIVILLAVAASAAFLFWPRIARATLWRATITPLASIIGSGFLVLGPILHVSFGWYAPFVMAVLCAGAWGFGSAIRFNIARRATGDRSRYERWMETAASWSLAFAYFISVAYYLNLFGAFGTELTPWRSDAHARLLTSAMLLVILAVGWIWGFRALERLETLSVSLKLAMIAGLLAGLAWFFVGEATTGGLIVSLPTVTGWPAIALTFGLIVTVQGFETSRYLGDEYDAATRIRSMRLAQIISTIIYLIYILLIAYVFRPDAVPLSETAIIQLMAIVAPILPILLTAAALAAQFSAAVADTGGSGGLVAELSGGRVSIRMAYVLLVAVGLVFTWAFDVFEIIAYASRGFALYYAIQSAIAALGARREERHALAAFYCVLAVTGLAIVVYGAPAE